MVVEVGVNRRDMGRHARRLPQQVDVAVLVQHPKDVGAALRKHVEGQVLILQPHHPHAVVGPVVVDVEMTLHAGHRVFAAPWRCR